MSRAIIVIDELPLYPKPLVPHESLVLFHHPITVGFLKHFKRLRPVSTQFHKKFDCTTFLQNLVQIFLGAVGTIAFGVALLQLIDEGDFHRSRFEA